MRRPVLVVLAACIVLALTAIWAGICFAVQMPAPFAGLGGVSIGSIGTHLAIYWYTVQRSRDDQND